jgi:hypothetical protein
VTTVLDRFRVVLLDPNGTFRFGEDRFGPGEDFAATYRSVGGRALEPRQVERAIRACYGRMAAGYEAGDGFRLTAGGGAGEWAW